MVSTEATNSAAIVPAWSVAMCSAIVRHDPSAVLQTGKVRGIEKAAKEPPGRTRSHDLAG